MTSSSFQLEKCLNQSFNRRIPFISFSNGYTTLSMNTQTRIIIPSLRQCLGHASATCGGSHVTPVGMNKINMMNQWNQIQIRTHKMSVHPRKFTAPRKEMPYKRKTHQGALQRWMVIPGGNFVRKKAGANKNGNYMRFWKRRQRSKLILATSTQKKLLRKLIPYFKKAYSRRLYGGVDIFKRYKEFIRH